MSVTGSSALTEARILVPVVFASIGTGLLTFSVPVFVAHHVGTRLGPEALAGYSLGAMIGNITARSIWQGLFLAYDTLGPRAFGRQEHGEVTVVMLRGCILTVAVLLPLVTVWNWAEPVLIALGQQPSSACLAARFLRLFQFVLPFNLTFEAARRYCLTYGVTWPLTGFSAAACVAVFFSADTLVGYFGFDAAALMYLEAFAIQAVGSLIYLLCNPPVKESKVLPGWLEVRKALSHRAEITEFLWLALPGLLGSSEWWFWEFTAFRAGVFGVKTLAAHSVAYMLVPLFFMLARGFRDATTMRCGCLLGQGKGAEARRIAKALCLIASVVVCAASGFAYVYRQKFVALMVQSSPDIDNYCEQIWGYLALFLVLDGLFPINQGVCVALGLQRRVSAAMVISLWMVGAPVVLVLANDFVSLWRIFPLNYVSFNILLILSYAFQDWDMVAEKASSRTSDPKFLVASAPFLNQEPLLQRDLIVVQVNEAAC